MDNQDTINDLEKEIERKDNIILALYSVILGANDIKLLEKTVEAVRPVV